MFEYVAGSLYFFLSERHYFVTSVDGKGVDLESAVSAVPLWVIALVTLAGTTILRENGSLFLLYFTAQRVVRVTHAAVAMISAVRRSTLFPCTRRVNRLYRAASYEIVGNFLAACNENEAAAKVAVEGDASPPEPRLVLAMNTNRGIRCAYQNAFTRTILKDNSSIPVRVN